MDADAIEALGTDPLTALVKEIESVSDLSSLMGVAGRLQLHGVSVLFHRNVYGDFVDPNRAEQIGLINQVVPDDELDAAVDALADKLAAKSAYGLSLGKQAFYRQLEMGISDAYNFTGAEMARNVMDRDAAEGFDAFIEKRQPVWDQSARDEPEAED